jgi:hypothetical protein
VAEAERRKGPTHVFIPLRGFPTDREGAALGPEGSRCSSDAQGASAPSIPYDELDLHINDDAFIVSSWIVRLMKQKG